MTSELFTRQLDRDVIIAKGPEAIFYLHSQLSQNIDDMVVGDSRLSFLLQPQGKVDALLRVSRTGEETLLLDTDAGFGESMVASLARFKLRTKVEFEPVDHQVVSVFGEGAREACSGDVVVVDGLIPGSVDLIGQTPVVAGATEMSVAELERRRVASAFPIMGIDIEEGAIPNESGLVERAVSFTKGCYRGQELVERIHARGGNRQLLQPLVVDREPGTGAVVRVGDRQVGSVTSVAAGEPVLAMAYVRGDVDPTDELTIVWPGKDGESVAVASRA
jgi:folate-binding protein YgfZ